MKTIVFLFFIILSTGCAFAQKETFDLVSYAPVKGWKQEQTDKSISFSNIDQKKNTFCMISIYKSLEGVADSKTNFDNSWQKIVQEPLGAENPKMEAPANENGWELQTGSAKFSKDGLEGIATLVTASSGNKMMNLLVLLNSDIYMPQVNGFISSMELGKITEGNDKNSTNGAATNSSISGTWSNGSGPSPQMGETGYYIAQYTFNPNGTYSFVQKRFSSYQAQVILFNYETGTYNTTGNQLTIVPAKGANEEWSVKPGTADKWGKLIKTGKRKLQKVTYSFTLHYFSGIRETNLVLQNNSSTERDGLHSSNNLYNNAWYYKPIGPGNTEIDVPPGKKL